MGLFIRHRRFLAAAIFIAVAGLLIWLWPKGSSPFPGKLPTPNGYDDFVKAGNAIPPNLGDVSRMTTDELRKVVNENAEVFRLMKEGLSKECMVPIEPSTVSFQGHLVYLSLVKRLAFLSAGRGRLFEAETNYGQASLFHLDTIRLGHNSARGGLIVNKLTGMTVEGLGIRGLERIVARLSVSEAREILREVESINSQSSPASEFIERDRKWAQMSLEGIVRMQDWLERRLVGGSDQKFTSQVQASDTRRRQLMLNLASHIYQLETGHAPKQPEDLVPSVLRALPKLDGNTASNSASRAPAP